MEVDGLFASHRLKQEAIPLTNGHHHHSPSSAPLRSSSSSGRHPSLSTSPLKAASASSQHSSALSFLPSSFSPISFPEPPAPPPSTYHIRRCLVCHQLRRIENLPSIPPPPAPFTCSLHPDPSLASCSLPCISTPAPLVRFSTLRSSPPYNFHTLGLLPFDDASYDLHLQHPEWGRLQTLWLLERVRDEGWEAVAPTVEADVVLASKGRDACEVRLLHVLAMAALYQRTVSVKAMPVNPFIQHIVPVKERTGGGQAGADAEAKDGAEGETARKGRPLSLHEQQQHAVAKKRSAALSAGPKRKRAKAAVEDDGDAGPRGSRSSGRLAGQKRKRYDDDESGEEDEEQQLADDDDRGKAQELPEFLWKIERVLAERQRRVPLDAQGQPVVDSSDDDSDDEKEGAGGREGGASMRSPRKLRLHREHSTELTDSLPPSSPTSSSGPPTTVITQYLIKIESQSYLHTEWHSRESLVAKFGERNASDRLTRYVKGKKAQEAVNADRYGGEPFDPRYVLVDRVIASETIELQDNATDADDAERKQQQQEDKEEQPGSPRLMDDSKAGDAETAPADSSLPFTPSATAVSAAADETPGKRQVEMFLVKWQGLSYSQATWESAEDIADELKIAQFRRFNRPPASSPLTPSYTREEYLARKDAWYPDSPVYKGKNRLRDYQVQGLNWLIKAWYDDRNGILADEMGLGKTLQTVTLFEHLRKVEYIPGPFLVIVPLGTLTHWKREVETWTDMNVVIYHDVLRGKETREVIRQHEFYYPHTKRIKFHICVTTYEVLISDIDLLAAIDFKYLVIDEGHRLKNKSSKILECLRLLKCHRRLLLTGTPIQNNTGELWTLLNFLEPDVFASAVKFEERFGALEESKQVEALQERIRPYVLRRMKEAVEKVRHSWSIPAKEETIIDIELTTVQKKYYRAIYEKNLTFLRQGVSRANMPRLVNMEIELRKCCQHPWLINGAEDKEVPADSSDEEYMQKTVAASGKLVLLAKLLEKMKREGHRVLIFSQFVLVLDLLQEFCDYKQYLYERLDGGVRGNEREAAIDRFVKPDSNRFLFLLSTRAGGVGLNLATADTVIIFDSDWNPQQDMQAQARAHRIGQKNKVSIYRLVTRNTYESEMFVKASKKLGLDHAVLTNLEIGRGGRGEDGGVEGEEEVDKDSIDRILRLGAYGLFDDEGDAKSLEFEQRDIDEILEKHSHVIRIGKGSAEGEEKKEEEEGKEEREVVQMQEEGKDTASSSAAAVPAAGGQFRLNYSKLRFSSEKDAIDINDSHFWEKMMGNTALILPPDELLSQLTDTSAYETPANKELFFTRLRRTVESILDAKRKGEDVPELDGLVNLLIQFLATKEFKEERPLAEEWLVEAERRVERKARMRTREEGGSMGGDRRSGRRRGLREEKTREQDGSDFEDSDASGGEGYDDEGERTKGGRVRGRAGALMNVDVCHVCWLSGSLLGCEGQCERWFHLECLGMDEAPQEGERWLCQDCKERNHQCRMCGKKSKDDYVSEEGVRCCSVPRCGLSYHLACVRSSPLTVFYSTSSTSSFKCPSHYCYRCSTLGEVYYVHCLTCERALHVKCMSTLEVRLARKLIFCEFCAPRERETERGRLAIEGSQVHTQAEPVRERVKQKRPRKSALASGTRRRRGIEGIKRMSKQRWASLTDDEKEQERQRRAKRKEEAKVKARLAQKERRAKKRQERLQRNNHSRSGRSDSSGSDDSDSDDSSQPSSGSDYSSSSSSSSSPSSMSASSPASSSSSSSSSSEEESKQPRFRPGVYTVRFKVDDEVEVELTKLPLFMAVGKRKRRKRGEREEKAARRAEKQRLKEKEQRKRLKEKKQQSSARKHKKEVEQAPPATIADGTDSDSRATPATHSRRGRRSDSKAVAVKREEKEEEEEEEKEEVRGPKKVEEDEALATPIKLRVRVKRTAKSRRATDGEAEVEQTEAGGGEEEKQVKAELATAAYAERSDTTRRRSGRNVKHEKERKPSPVHMKEESEEEEQGEEDGLASGQVLVRVRFSINRERRPALLSRAVLEELRKRKAEATDEEQSEEPGAVTTAVVEEERKAAENAPVVKEAQDTEDVAMTHADSPAPLATSGVAMDTTAVA